MPNAARGITASSIFFWVATEGWHGPESGLECDYEKIRAIGNSEKAVQPGDRVDIVIGTLQANQLVVELAVPGNHKERGQEMLRLREVCMDENRIAKRVAVTVASLFLGATPGLTREQSAPGSSPPQSAALASVQTAPHAATPGVRPKSEATPEDDFAGLTYTDEQKAKIAKIEETARMRADAIRRDEKLNPDQKHAMLDGYRRMEMNEMFRVLTPEQQAEVRKKAVARHKALIEEQKQLKGQQQKRQQQKPPLPPQ